MRSKVLCVLAVLVGGAAAQVSDSNLPLPPNVLRIYVDALTGDDATGNGSQPWPFRTITAGYASLAAYSLPAVVVVNDGVYSSMIGEAFPIRMRPLHLVMGRNAHTVIVQGGGGGTGFELDGILNPAGFHPLEGPYLQRMTVRGFQYGVYFAGPRGSCNVVEPVVDALIAYDNTFAFAGEDASPTILDCTITQNANGIYKFVFVAEDCCPWSVANTICVGNGQDLFDITEGEIVFSDFDPIFCAVSAVGAMVCGYAVPTVGSNGNVVVNPVGFVDPTGGATLPISGLTTARDLRLDAGSPLIGAGTATGALWDGEGVGNYRTGPRQNRAVDIGADQYNDLRAFPLANASIITPNGPRPYVGVAAENLAFRIASAGVASHIGVLNDFTVMAQAPTLNPITMQGTAGSLWVFPNFPLMSFTWASNVPSPAQLSFQVDGPLTVVAPVNQVLGIVLPYPLIAPVWTRCTLQFLTAESVAPFNRLTELQDYRFAL